MTGKRIGIDARFSGNRDGLARYTRELIDHLAKLKTSHTFVIFVRPEAADLFDHLGKNFEVRRTTIPHYSFREQTRLGSELDRAELDLMHFTNFNLPVTYRKPFVVSFHDLTLLKYPGRSRTSRLKMIPMRRVVQAGLTHSRQVIIISEYQKQLVKEHFGVGEDKIQVIYESVDSRFKPLPKARVDAFRRRSGLTDPFVMYTGQWRPHKNLVRLLKAFKQVRREHPCKLVLVGKRDPAFPVIPETIAREGIGDDVITAGYVSDDELPLYYNAAETFAFPSLAEGFGLTPLEAMACGTPVASSQAEPMPEILGDAASFFDPHSTADAARTINKTLSDRRLRARLRSEGFRQVKRYSWSKMAQQTLAVYESVLS